MKKIDVLALGAREKFLDWIKNRGGVQVWRNLNLSNPDAGNQYTPYLNITRDVQDAPHWSVGRGELITDITRFRFVKGFKEVKRFHVGVRMGGNGLSVKVTDGGSRRIRAALDKYPGSVYHFDYEYQDAVIEVPEWEEE
jgi:hypothetical protein